MRRVCMIGVILAGTLLTGCGGQPGSRAPGRTGSPPTAARQPDPAALIGLWTPIGAGEQPDTRLRIMEHTFDLFRRCHWISGSWGAEGGLFVGAPNGYALAPDQQGCVSEEQPNDLDALWPWLARVTTFRAAGPDQLLLDRQGNVVVRLQPSTFPADRPDLLSDPLGVPVVTDDVRRDYRPAAPLPASLTPVTTAALLGRWRPDPTPTAVRPRQPYVEFRDGAKWIGSDGCNGVGGPWAVGPAGAFVAPAGAHTLVGCHNVPVDAWLDNVRRAGFDKKGLVLLDGAGKEVGRLRRVSPQQHG